MRGRVNHLYKQHLLRMTSIKCYGLSEWLPRLIDKCLKQWISMSMMIGCHAQTPKSLSPYRYDVHFVIWLHFPVPAVMPPWEQYLKSLPFCVRNFRIRIWEYLGYFLMYYCPCWSVGMNVLYYKRLLVVVWDVDEFIMKNFILWLRKQRETNYR